LESDIEEMLKFFAVPYEFQKMPFGVISKSPREKGGRKRKTGLDVRFWPESQSKG